MSLSSTFKKACENKYGDCNTANGECLPKPVQDEYVATIKVSNGNCTFCRNSIYNDKKARPKDTIKEIENEEREVICIVLESPHKDEYNSSGEPLGPALSSTGKNISDHFVDILNDAIKNGVVSITDGDYSLLLIEAVSYQCSNAQSLNITTNKNKRDKVFAEAWENGGKEDFLERIRSANPILIVNSCTGRMKNVDNEKSLKGKINEALISAGYDEITVSSPHPSSSWFWRKGIKK